MILCRLARFRLANFQSKHDDAYELIHSIFNRLLRGKMSQAWEMWTAVVGAERDAERVAREAAAAVHITRVGRG